MGLGDRIVASVVDVRAHAQRLLQLNIELLKAELQKKGQQYGAAVGLFAAAAVLALYAFGVLLALIVVALSLVVPLWLSLLIVTAVLFVVVAVLALVGRGRLAAAKTAPLRAGAEAQATVGQLREGIGGVVASVSTPVPAAPPGPVQTPLRPVVAGQAAPRPTAPTGPDAPRSPTAPTGSEDS